MRVASVPRRHAYTRHIGWPGDGVTRIATPDATYRASDLVDACWVREHRDDFDCMHAHFGFGDVGLDALQAWLEALAEVGRPLVHTVHDLENPHHAGQDHHRRQLDLLVPAAAEVVTLTGCAADRVEHRWGRRPVVLPHPHIVELERVGRPGPPADPLVVGVHLKDLRAAIHGPELWEPLAEVIAADDRYRLRIDVYPAAVERDPAARRCLDELATRLDVDVALRPYGSDGDFEDYLRSIDVAVLPYRWGTHSGWAEACLDVGTQVVAPAHTCIPDQHERFHAADLDAPTLREELCRLLDRCWDRRRQPPVTQAWRTAQRRAARRRARRHLRAGHGVTAAERRTAGTTWPPTRTIVLSATPRTGSTLACDVLAGTEQLGYPKEPFAEVAVPACAGAWEVPPLDQDLERYLRAAFTNGTTPNGICRGQGDVGGRRPAGPCG